MLQRPFRLRHRRDFQRLRAEGKSWQGAPFLISVSPNQLPHNRYGFIVGKRIGKAVVRNRLRRQLREAVRSLHHQIKQGYDLVVIARPPSLALAYWDLRQVLIKMLRQAGLYVI